MKAHKGRQSEVPHNNHYTWSQFFDKSKCLIVVCVYVKKQTSDNIFL